jgi:hypothetical protein
MAFDRIRIQIQLGKRPTDKEKCEVMYCFGSAGCPLFEGWRLVM